MSVEQNRANIQKNRRAIFELESQVNYVRAQAYLTRSTIQENSLLIQKNQVAAFWGNRQLANYNTQDLFANRLAIVRATPAAGPVQENLREALTNQVKLEYLDHRSKLNAKVLEISEKLAAINEQVIQVNREIMAANQGIVEFNAATIAKNAAWLQNGIGLEGASPASNAEIIAANAAKIAEIRARSDANKAALGKVLDHTTANRGRILANTTDIYERRQQIVQNHSKIAANQQLVASLIAKSP